MSRFFRAFEGIKINIRNLIAIIVICSITGIIILGHFKEIPIGNKELINGAVNQYLVVGFAVVIAFYFVSSKGAEDKEKHEQKIEEQKAGGPY